MEYDKGAKDITRVFFTPTTEKLLFVDDELFERRTTTPIPSFGHPSPVEGEGDSNNPSDNPSSNSLNMPISNSSQAGKGNLLPCPSTGKGMGKGVGGPLFIVSLVLYSSSSLSHSIQSRG